MESSYSDDINSMSSKLATNLTLLENLEPTLVIEDEISNLCNENLQLMVTEKLNYPYLYPQNTINADHKEVFGVSYEPAVFHVLCENRVEIRLVITLKARDDVGYVTRGSPWPFKGYLMQIRMSNGSVSPADVCMR